MFLVRLPNSFMLICSTGNIVGIVLGLIIFKILIVSCIVYYRRRRAAVPYMVVPNTATVATVVQSKWRCEYFTNGLVAELKTLCTIKAKTVYSSICV